MWLTKKKQGCLGAGVLLYSTLTCELIVFSCIRARRPIIVDILEGVGQSIFSGVEFMFNNIWKKKIPSRLDKKDIYIYTSLCTWCHVTNLYIDIDWPSFMKYSCITLQAFIHCSAMPFGDTCACISTYIYIYIHLLNHKIYLCCGLKVSQSTLSHIHYKQGLVNVVTPVCVSARQNYRDLFDGGSYLFHAMVTTRARCADCDNDELFSLWWTSLTYDLCHCLPFQR